MAAAAVRSGRGSSDTASGSGGSAEAAPKPGDKNKPNH
jgi:hypothetical protein